MEKQRSLTASSLTVNELLTELDATVKVIDDFREQYREIFQTNTELNQRRTSLSVQLSRKLDGALWYHCPLCKDNWCEVEGAEIFDKSVIAAITVSKVNFVSWCKRHKSEGDRHE